MLTAVTSAPAQAAEGSAVVRPYMCQSGGPYVSIVNNYGTQYGHAEYGAWQKHLYVETSYMSGSCSAYDQQFADTYLDDGVGWKVWTNTTS